MYVKSSSSKSKTNYKLNIRGCSEITVVMDIRVTRPRWTPWPFRVKTLKMFFLRDQRDKDFVALDDSVINTDSVNGFRKRLSTAHF